MGLLDFWRKKKPEEIQNDLPEQRSKAHDKHADPQYPGRSIAKSVDNKIEDKKTDPAEENLQKAYNNFKSLNFEKANDYIDKAIELGGKPDEKLMTSIRSFVNTLDTPDTQTLELKRDIILKSISSHSHIEFLYPKEQSRYLQLIFICIPTELASVKDAVMIDGERYEIKNMRKLKFVNSNYYPDKPQ
ncbi:hypothetical protein [Kaistella pullorum]|uniref:Uncharacterized protein n=1 Tax=Kaistella pullorum TaxID=2763074 RepID=A0ABR8WM38_9FLAO|nr:hypothetical protein [Kaistella pullorum]MBD8018137.1 hypothetical protein [Kaistella pullorum]